MRKRKGLIWCWLVLGSAGLWPAPGSGQAFELKPESLRYAIDAVVFKDVARATFIFNKVGPNLYEAEIDGSVQGFVTLFTGRRRDRFRSRMIFTEGKLKPLFFSEEIWRRTRYRRREYHFHRDKGRLELWATDGKGPIKLTWHTDLPQPIYDPVCALYNFRLGALGEIKPGETIVVPSVAYPQPEDIIFRIGPEEGGLQKVGMQVRKQATGEELGTLHMLFDRQWVPVEAWTWLGVFGKISGHLQERPAVP